MKESLLKLEAAVVHAEEVGVVLMLVVITATLAMQIISRFFLTIPLDWTEEVARGAQIWLVFLGAAVGARRAEHFVVELFMERVNFPGKAMLARAVDIVVIGFFLLMAVVAALATKSGAGQVMPTLGLSIAWIYTAIPVGCALMAFHFVMGWVRPFGGHEISEGVAE